jgi:ankyrin repeat protein
MHALKYAFAALAAASLAVPATAQDGGYDGAQFVKAIQEGKSDDAVKLFKAKPSLVNARDFNGQTALVAAIDVRDDQWAGYLLQQGADPNLPGTGRETPLMAAARRGLPQVVDWLIQLGAKVDAENNRGETALIVAVQNVQEGQIPIVQALLDAGADPDKADSAQGYSARDYARQKNRVPGLLQIIEAKRPKR